MLPVKLIFSFVLGAVLGAGTAAGGEADRLEGRIVDPSNVAVPGATAVLRNVGTGFERAVRADAAGRFAFAGLAGGPYALVVQARGFDPAEEEVTPGAEAVTITLDPAPVVEMVTVVSGSRRDEVRESLNARVEVVSTERIRDTGYETAGEILSEVPGVVSRRGSETAAAAGEQVQGIESRQVLVLLDGQPLVGARGIKAGVLNLDRQSLARLDRIEVVKGASLALYGSDAIGGVVNLVTRDPGRPLEASVVTSGGDQGRLSTYGNLGFNRDKAQGFFDLERHHNDGFDLTPSTPDMTGAETRRWNALGKLRFALSDATALSLFGDGYWNKAEGRSIGELGLQQDHIDDQAANLGTTFDWRPSARTTVQARAYHSRYDETDNNTVLVPGAPPLQPGELRQRLTKLDASAVQVWGERQLLQGGVCWWTDEYRGVNRLRDDSGNDMTTTGGWLQDRVNLLPRLTVTLGARFDDNSAFGSAFSPKVAIHFRAGERANLRASYGRGFRAPDLGQLYSRFLDPTNFYQVIGNPNLQPEHSNSYQVGGEFRATGRRARLGLNLFRNDLTNLIDAVPLGFAETPAQLAEIMAREGIDPSFRPVPGRLVFFYKNVSDARTQGIEADAELVFGGGLSAYGSYTYLDAKNTATDSLLTNRSKHAGSFRVSWESDGGGTRANVRGTFYGSWLLSRATVGGQIVEELAPSFSIWDAYVARRIVAGLELFGAVDNFTDSQDPNTGRLRADGTPLALSRADVGRSFRVGLRWEWAR